MTKDNSNLELDVYDLAMILMFLGMKRKSFVQMVNAYECSPETYVHQLNEKLEALKSKKSSPIIIDTEGINNE